MDRKIIKGFGKLLVLESIFSGASSLSRIFGETEDELDDMMKYVDKRFQTQKILDNKLFKKGKF